MAVSSPGGSRALPPVPGGAPVNAPGNNAIAYDDDDDPPPPPPPDDDGGIDEAYDDDPPPPPPPDGDEVYGEEDDPPPPPPPLDEGYDDDPPPPPPDEGYDDDPPPPPPDEGYGDDSPPPPPNEGYGDDPPPPPPPDQSPLGISPNSKLRRSAGVLGSGSSLDLEYGGTEFMTGSMQLSSEDEISDGEGGDDDALGAAISELEGTDAENDIFKSIRGRIPGALPPPPRRSGSASSTPSVPLEDDAMPLPMRSRLATTGARSSLPVVDADSALRAENAMLREQLEAAQASFGRFTERVKVKLAEELAQKRMVTDRHTKLRASIIAKENELAARRHTAALLEYESLVAATETEGDHTAPPPPPPPPPEEPPAYTEADEDEREQLLAQAVRLAQQKKETYKKIHSKLQQLVYEKHNAILRVRELEETYAWGSVAIARLRKDLARLSEEKEYLMHKLKEHRTAAQNARMWDSQNTQLREEVARKQEQRAGALAKVDELTQRLGSSTTRLEEIQDNIVASGRLRKKYRAQVRALKETQRNTYLWTVQNVKLAQHVSKLANLNRRLGVIAESPEAEADALRAEIAENEAVCDAIRAEVASVRAVTSDHRASVPRLESEIGDLLAEKGRFKIEIQSIEREGVANVGRNETLRTAVERAQEDRHRVLLEVDKLSSKLEQVKEIDALNDNLRYQMIELLDENSSLANRLDQLWYLQDGGTLAEVDYQAASLSPDAATAGGSDTATGVNSPRVGGQMMMLAKVSSSPLLNKYTELQGKDGGVRATSFEDLTALISQQKAETVDDMLERVQDAVEEELERADANRRVKRLQHRRRPVSARSHTSGDEMYENTDEVKYEEEATERPGHRNVRGIRCATLEKLVERLTYEKYPDTEFVQAFVLTYRSFTTPVELLEMVIKRYCLIADPDMSDAEAVRFKQEKIIPIRLRVFNMLKIWIDKHFDDFRANDELLASLLDFADTIMAGTGMERAANTIRGMVEERLAFDPPAPLQYGRTPPTKQFRSALYIDARVFAQNLCLIEMELYASIQPNECLNLKNAPTLKSISEHFNAVSLWCSSEILRGGRPRERAKAITWFIKLAKILQDLNNIMGVMEIVSGINNAAVMRLKKTWPSVNSRYKEALAQLKEFVSHRHNYRNMRDHLKFAKAPCIPYVGIYQTDLTFIHDANPDMIDGLIHWTKRKMVADVIKKMLSFQDVKYDFAPENNVAWYIHHLPYQPSNGLYETSLLLEPREVKK